MKRNIISTIIGVSAIAFSGFASAEYLDLTGWGINASGTGVSDVDNFHSVDTVDIRGHSYVDTEVNSNTGNPATFTDYGIFHSSIGYSGAAGTPSMLSDSFTATFNDWTGSYTSFNGNAASFNFTGGTTTWRTDTTGLDVLSLEIMNGSGDIDFVEPTTGQSNGGVNIIFKITDVEAGYFFIDQGAAGYVDLYDILYGDQSTDPDIAMTPTDLYVGITVMTNEFLPTNDPDYREVIDRLTQSDIGAPIDDDNVYSSATASVGSYNFAEKVPEPGMLSLMGLALLGLAGFQRKRNAKKH